MDLKVTDLLLLALIVSGLFGSGVACGRWAADRSWRAKLPASMDLLCKECERTGEEVMLERLETEGRLCK